MPIGVLLTQLCCPTCGALYKLPLTMWQESYELDSFDDGSAIKPATKRGVQSFVECPAGHRWTVQTLVCSIERPSEVERVQLAAFVGGGL